MTRLVWNKLNILPGDKFGRWTVVEEESIRDKNSRRRFLCLCECGVKKSVALRDLRAKSSTSCGCYQKEINTKRSTTHGDSRTKFYRVWVSMIERCEKPYSTRFKWYGDSGISVCENWHNYNIFKKDMLESYNKHATDHGVRNTTIERKNNDENYCKENCCWVTRKEQARNTRRIKKFIAKRISDGYEVISNFQDEFSVKYGVSGSKISCVLHGHRKQTGGWTFRYLTEGEKECAI